MRACRFSSATLKGASLKTGCSVAIKLSYISFMGKVSCEIPKFFARSTASVTEWSVEKREGISMPSTFSFPRASVANAATRAESIPPESPSTAFENPFCGRNLLFRG